MNTRRVRVPDDLQTIPGVGPSIAADLRTLGYDSVAQLRGADPEDLFLRLKRLRGGSMDRCVLYLFRCAVYYARTPRPRPERLRWWWWKDTPPREEH